MLNCSKDIEIKLMVKLMVKSIPYLLVQNGKRAIKLYKEVFGAELVSSQAFSPEMGKPMGFPDDFDYENSTMHAILDIGGAQVFLTDGAFGHPVEGRVEVVLELDSSRQGDEIWAKVKSKKFKIVTDYKKTGWGGWYGRFADSEGVGWMLNFQEKQEK